MRIGIAGTGRMGSAIARRLLGLGHTVVVWNRTPERARALEAEGARRVGTPRDVTEASDIVLTILTHAAAVEAVHRGEDGLLDGSARGRLFVEMSTVQPGVHRTLAVAARAAGAAYMDCPVGGTVGPASEGRLLGLAGGDAVDLARAMPLLSRLCRRVEHVGPVGAGATLKLAMNLLTQVFWQSFGEAAALCAPLGLPAERLVALFDEASGAPPVFHHRAADIAAALAGSSLDPPHFDVDSVRKDMRTMLAEAAEIGCRLPVVERVLECLDLASGEGKGRADCTAIPAIWAARARPGA